MKKLLTILFFLPLWLQAGEVHVGTQIFTGFSNSVPFFDSDGKLTPLTLGTGQAARRNAANTGFEAFSPATLDDSRIVGSYRNYQAEVASAIDSAISGKTASATTLNLFSTRDDTNGIYVWNTACWAAKYDFTCISVWNSRGGNTQGGVAITRRHVVLADHFSGVTSGNPWGAGVTMRFVAKDGTVVTRTTTAGVQIGSSDIYLCTLDSDLPTSITPASILPASFSTLTFPAGTPIIFTNQIKEARIGEIDNYRDASGIGEPNLNRVKNSVVSPRSSWGVSGGPAVSQDSGSPLFMTYPQGKLSLLCLFHFAFGGEDLSSNLAAINAITGSSYPVAVSPGGSPFPLDLSLPGALQTASRQLVISSSAGIAMNGGSSGISLNGNTSINTLTVSNSVTAGFGGFIGSGASLTGIPQSAISGLSTTYATLAGNQTLTGVTNIQPAAVSASPSSMTIAGQTYSGSSGTPGALTIQGAQNTGVDGFGTGGSVTVSGGPSASAFGYGGNLTLAGGTNTSNFYAFGSVIIGAANTGSVKIGSGSNPIYLGSTSNYFKSMRSGTSNAMTAGAVTVSDSGATANTRYLLTCRVLGTVTTPQAARVSSRTTSTNFVITSASSSDTSTWDWIAIEP